MRKAKYEISPIFTLAVRNNKLLYSTFFIILITLLVRWWVEEQFALLERNEKFIESAIKTEVLDQEFDMIPVLDSLAIFGSIGLEKSPQQAYPFFVYQLGKIKYWSDFKYVPAYTDIKSIDRYGFIDKPYGQFIVRKWVVNYKDNSYEVFSFIPLYRKYPISNAFIESGVNPKIGKNGELKFASPESSLDAHIVEINGYPICKIKLSQGYKPSIVQPIVYIDFVLLMLQIVLYFALYKVVLKRKKAEEIIVIILGWAYFKVALPFLEGATSFAKINLFDPQYYAVSWFERSFADLLINTIFILLISFRIQAWMRNKKFINMFLKAEHTTQAFVARTLLILFTFWIINYPFFQLRSIYDNSQVSIDISQSLQFDWIRIVTYVIVIIISLSTFLLYHSIARYFLRYTQPFKLFATLLLIGLLVYLPLSFVANMPFANLALVNVLIISILWYFNFAKSLNTATYKRFLYIALFFGIISGITGYFIHKLETQIKITNTQSLLKKKLAKSDPFAEFLVSTALSDLSTDPFIVARMGSPFLSKKAIVTKIKQVFLNSYLNKYEQTIVLFDSRGVPLRNFDFKSTLFERLSELAASNSATNLPPVFRVQDELPVFSKHYIGYAPIKKGNNVIGYVLLELIEKPFTNSGNYPSLFVDNRFSSPESNETSFAYYINGILVNSIGSNEFPPTMVKEIKKVWNENDLLFVLDADNERSILASTSIHSSRVILSNFSFIWSITLFPILLFWLVISLAQKGEFKSLSYTDRIIWYLNLAFIIPLILVTAVTFRLLSRSFETDSNLTKTSLVERLSNQLSSSLANYHTDKNEYDNLQERIEILSNNTELDINLFNLDGELISTSQPSVFNKKILSSYINQYALNVIKNKGKNHLVIQETIDQFKYGNSYVAVKSEDLGEILGVISVPFFSSRSTLISSKREAFNTILNVFVMVLFATMLATYFAGKWLTRPLRIIRDKLKATSFSEQTEPINIQWTDELGLLIRAYNQMLATLEESKTVLKQSEKEKAWREAAQQVAHEIKNPLTPMKLTLQRIGNKIKLDSTNPKDLERPVQSVLDQVETLNSIASSFSEFAKMPTPVVERVEIHAIIRNSIELFKGEPALKIKLHLANKAVYSLVDPKLLLRMLNNLILNAKQSIKENQKEVEVEITTKIGANLVISITDNGAGIDSEIADKVFIPKFTTKEQGSGIGLAMTKYGVENMRGKIYFSSEVNAGTTFTLEFPIID